MMLKAHNSSVIVCAALTTHFYFRKREPTAVRVVLAVLLGAPALLHAFFRAGFVGTPGNSIAVDILLYNTVLLTSILVYRLSPFHPLSKYPGPLICRVSRLWACYQATGRQQRFYYQRLFEEYGDVVRIGPNHLIIRDVKAIPIVLGSASSDNRWIRGARYNIYLGTMKHSSGSLLESMTPADHIPRRRIWDRAFSPAALKDYEQALQHRISQLIDGLSRSTQETLDLRSWFHYFSIDFMGDIGFASSFSFLEKGRDDEGFLNASETNMAVWEIFGMIPWTNMIIRKIVPYHPYTKKSLIRGLNTLDKRMSFNGLIKKDIFFHLMDENGESGHSPLSRDTLASEAMLVLIAGSDTTAVALTNIFFYILSQPDVLVKLRNEIEEAVPPEVQYPDASSLAQLPYLRAIINETLRLHPAVPGGAHRRPPPNGRPAIIGDMLIPQGTTVQIPTWNIHRDPRYFWPHPESFWPERWLEGAERTTADFRLNMTAYTPFSFGPTGCVGKHLASNELRLAIVTLIRNFEIKLESKLDHPSWREKQDEIFVLMSNELPVTLTPRV